MKIEALPYYIILPALAVLIPLIEATTRLRKDEGRGWLSPKNQTFWGVTYWVFSATLIFLTLSKAVLDKKELDIDKMKTKAFQDSILSTQDKLQKSYDALLAESGLERSHNGDKILVSNYQKFLKTYNLLPVDTVAQQKRNLGTDMPTKISQANIERNPAENSIVKNETKVDIPKQIPKQESVLDVDLGRSYIRRYGSNSSLYQGFGRIMFTNRKSFGIKLYYAIRKNYSSGEGKGIFDIAPGTSAISDDLLVGETDSDAPISPTEASYDFFFVTSSPTQSRLFGKITARVKLSKESRITLNDDNLIMTEIGAREKSALRAAGVNE